jgi:hypothetical protein
MCVIVHFKKKPARMSGLMLAGLKPSGGRCREKNGRR